MHTFKNILTKRLNSIKMKKTFIVVINILIHLPLVAQETSYQEALSKAFQAWEVAEGLEAKQEVANTMERIASTANDQWFPSYCMAYAYTLMNFDTEDGDKKESLLDTAQKWLDQAEELLPEADKAAKAEILSLQSFIFLGRITVKPMMRGMSYGNKIQEVVDQVHILDPKNPRPDYVLGSYYEGMPSMFGGGMEAACPYFQRSHELFQSYTPVNELAPDWGKLQVAELVKSCKK